MKGKSLTFAGIIALIIAALLIMFCKNINVAGVTISCGILFMGVGVINLIFFSFKSKAESSRILNLITNAGAIVLGICMLVFKAQFEPMITFMFGLFVGVCALWQFFVLAIGARPFQLPAWLYLFPVLLTAGAVVLFMHQRHETDTAIMLTTGISMTVLGVGCIFEGSALGLARRRHEKASSQLQTSDTATKADDHVPSPAKEAHAQEEEQPQTKRPETTEDLDDEIS